MSVSYIRNRVQLTGSSYWVLLTSKVCLDRLAFAAAADTSKARIAVRPGKHDSA